MMKSPILALLLCYVTVASSLRLLPPAYEYTIEREDNDFAARKLPRTRTRAEDETIRTVFGINDDTLVKQVIPFKLTEKMIVQQKIENCEVEMSSCAYSVDELVQKIFEQENISPDIEEGLLERPDITAPLQPGIDALRPDGGKSMSCKEACNRHATTKRYMINCRDILFDETKTKYLYMRKIKMIRCYRCRANCNKGNVFS